MFNLLLILLILFLLYKISNPNEKFTEIDTGDFDSNYRILKQQLLAIDPAYA